VPLSLLATVVVDEALHIALGEAQTRGLPPDVTLELADAGLDQVTALGVLLEPFLERQ